jgi:CDP-diacylglycerol pyrophosphatase
MNFLRTGATLLLLTVSLATGCTTQNSRLQKLVTSCTDLSGEDYCTACPWPRSDSSCERASVCAKSTEIWRENENYIAIRDKKMCSCTQSGFVHGLAIPRAMIKGVESANRPGGIWDFAWKTGLERGIAASNMALVINPANDRSENQLHIHIVRLKDDARNSFPKGKTTATESLAKTWQTATASAASNNLPFYGVLAAQNPAGGYFVVVSPESPEDLYTVARCPTKD